MYKLMFLLTSSHSSVAVVYSHIHTTYYSDIATIRNVVQVY